jgi:hypothetical protein
VSDWANPSRSEDDAVDWDRFAPLIPLASHCTCCLEPDRSGHSMEVDVDVDMYKKVEVEVEVEVDLRKRQP